MFYSEFPICILHSLLDFSSPQRSKPRNHLLIPRVANLLDEASGGDRTELSVLPTWSMRCSSRERVESVTASLTRLKTTISEDDWTNFGFKKLNTLGIMLENIDKLKSVDEVYAQLTPLRMWMSCVELDGEAKHQPLSKVMRICFYVLLMAITPYMSATCSGKFSGLCKFMIEKIQKEGFGTIDTKARDVFELFCKQNRFI